MCSIYCERQRCHNMINKARVFFIKIIWKSLIIVGFNCKSTFNSCHDMSFLVTQKSNQNLDPINKSKCVEKSNYRRQHSPLAKFTSYGNSFEVLFFPEVTESLSSIALFDNHFSNYKNILFSQTKHWWEMAITTLLKTGIHTH